MDNYKIKVKDEAESKEAQELFEQLGYSNGQSKRFGFVYTQNGEIGCDSMEHWDYYNDLCQELTLPQLRDLVVLKRNDVKDATHEDQYGDKWLYLDERHYVYLNYQWSLPTGEFLERYELKPIEKSQPQDPALISGAEALRALADGKEVEANNSDFGYWIDARNLSVKDFFDDIHIFRLKPQTIKLELELPKPFEPKDGETYWHIYPSAEKGYHFVRSFEDDDVWCQFGAWRTEDEIKQVVEQLRKIRGTNS
ncbi:hypothetical protein V3N00_15805 [Acinetobacter baumannii]|uniref:hypothetical protein n=1 Tax=Acinetobacter baumannii TaxID=470 RepID=UPI002F2C09F9